MPNSQTTIRFGVYDYEVRVIMSRDIVATGRRLRTPLTGCIAAYITDPSDPLRGWMVLGPASGPGTIAHESAHAVRAMFEAVGAEIDDEMFAYHLGFLVTRIHKFMERS